MELPFKFYHLPRALTFCLIATIFFGGLTLGTAQTAQDQPELNPVSFEDGQVVLEVRGPPGSQVIIESGTALDDLSFLDRVFLPDDGVFSQFLVDFPEEGSSLFIAGKLDESLTVPTLDLGLADSSGAQTDKPIANRAAAVVTIADGQPLSAVEAALNPDAGGTFQEFTGKVTDKKLHLVPTDFESLNSGKPLGEGRHSLRVRATDTDGNANHADLSFVIDRTPPEVTSSLDGTLRRETFEAALPVPFSERIDPGSVTADGFSLTHSGQGSVNLAGVRFPDPDTVALQLNQPLPDGTYELTIAADVADLAGNTLPSSRTLSFEVADPPEIEKLSPAPGADMVNVALEPVVRFDEPVDPETLGPSTIRFMQGGDRILGELRPSSTEKFVTFFPRKPLPSSTEIKVRIDGDAIMGRDGRALDADGDGEPGGMRATSFRTLPLTRIEGTSVFGFVKDSMTGAPIEGVTLTLDAFPEVSAVTDANGRFELENVPAPEFFVVIDGSTAKGTSAGMTYPTLGKSFTSVPGKRTQISKNGEPFDVDLPLMSLNDITELSSTQATEVEFGDFAMQQAQQILPEVDPSLFEQMRVDFPPGSAQDDEGNPATQGSVIPVPPDRLPGELPATVDPELVVSVQAGSSDNLNSNGGASRFDTPAPITFPNLSGLEPGKRTQIFSFNHDKGRFEPTAIGVVSEDGTRIESLPGEGLSNPGWHFTDQSTSEPLFGGGGSDDGGNGNGGGGGDSRSENVDVEEKVDKTREQLSQGLNNQISALAGFASRGLSGAAKSINENAIQPAFSALGIAQDAADNGEIGSTTKRSMAANIGSEITEDPASDAFDAAGTVSDADAARQNYEKAADCLSSTITFGTPGRAPDRKFRLQNQGRSTTLEGIARNEFPALEDSVRRMHNALTSLNEGLLLIQEVFHTLDGRSTNDPKLINQLVEGARKVDTAKRLIVEEGPGSIDALFNQIEQQSREILTILSDNDLVNDAPAVGAYYQVTALESGDIVARGQIKASGLTTLQLAPNSRFLVKLADPLSNRYAEMRLRSGDIGEDPPPIRLLLADVFNNRNDSDGDGLLDRVESALPVDKDKPDSDGDGIGDRAEYRQGSDPAGGAGLPTGIVSTVPINGYITDLEVVGSGGSGSAKRAYVAAGNGLAIVDATEIDRLVLEGTLELPHGGRGVAVDSLAGIAVVTSTDGLSFIDVSDPSTPTLLNTVNAAVDAPLAIQGGILYTSNGTYDVLTQEKIGDFPAGALPGNIDDLRVSGGDLFVLTESHVLKFDASPLLGEDPVAEASINGFATRTIRPGRDRLYVPGLDSSVSSLDVTPIGVFSRDTLAKAFQIDITSYSHLDLSNRSLALVSGGTVQPNDADLVLLETGSPSGNFLVGHTTPGQVTAIEIGSGVALVGDGFSGLHGVVYQPFDTGDEAPSIQFDTAGLDTDPGMPGIQVPKGSLVPLVTQTSDDRQTRDVEFIVNGQIVDTDVDYPFESSVVAQATDQRPDSMVVQARAFDTGGNRAMTQEITLDLIPEVIRPNLTDFGAKVANDGRRILRFEFSEAMDLATLSDSTITVTAPSGNTLSLVHKRQNVSSEGTVTVTLVYPALRELGTYQVDVDDAQITDRAGNALNPPSGSFSFEVRNVAPNASLVSPTAPVSTSSPVIEIVFSEPIDAHALRQPGVLILTHSGKQFRPDQAESVDAQKGYRASFRNLAPGTYDIVLDADSLTDRQHRAIVPTGDLTLGPVELQADTSGPVLTRVDGQTQGSNRRELSLTFDEPLAEGDINTQNFQAVDESGNTLNFLDAKLTDLRREVVLRLSPTPDNIGLALMPNRIRDDAGNPVTGPSNPLEVPKITGSDPAAGATLQTGPSTIRLSFSEALASSAFQSSTYRITHLGNGTSLTIERVRSLNNGSTAEIDLGSALGPGRYEVRLNALQMLDADESLPLGLTDAVRLFEVGQAGGSGFRIVSRSPNDGETVRSIDSRVRIEFSSPVDETTVDAFNFELRDASGRAVAPKSIGLNLDEDADILTADYPPLATGKHTFTIRAAQVQDQQGNALGTSTQTISFVVPSTPAIHFPRPLVLAGYDSSSYTKDIAVFDADGDGQDDLIAATGARNNQPGYVPSLNVRLGRGGGLFTPVPTEQAHPELSTRLSSPPTAMAHADVNDDNVPDVLITQQGNFGRDRLSILLGTGSGGFQDPQATDIANSPREPIEVVAGEFTGDNVVDAATLNTGDNTVSLFTRDVNGQVSGQSTVHTAGANVTDLARGDFNGDGTDDLAITTAGQVTVLLADGSGGFESPRAFAANTEAAAIEAIIPNDIDGDGNLDLAIAAREPNHARILLGDGNGSFSSDSDRPLQVAPTTVTTADVNADGDPDLLVAGKGGVQVLLNNGNGGLNEATFYPASVGTDVASLAAEPVALAAGDFDNDNAPDLFTADARHRMAWVLRGKGNGAFQVGEPTEVFPNADFPSGIGPRAAGDFDGDGDTDIVAGGSAGFTTADKVALFLNDGSGAFSKRNEIVMAPGGMITADFDDDGNLDVASVGEAPTKGFNTALFVARNNGDGTFQQPSTTSLSSQDSVIAAADFNADGNTDLAVGSPDANEVMLMPGNGDGSFDSPQPLAPTAATFLEPGDFNGNGAPGLAVGRRDDPFGSNTPDVEIFLNDGSGTLSSPEGTSSIPGGPTDLEVADLEGDGDLDVMIANGASGEDRGVTRFMNKGAGTFSKKAPLKMDRAPADGFSPDDTANPESVGVADINGDGHADLVTLSNPKFSAMPLSVRLGKPDGSLSPAFLFDGGAGSHNGTLILLDADGQGRDDIVIAGHRENHFQLLLSEN